MVRAGGLGDPDEGGADAVGHRVPTPKIHPLITFLCTSSSKIHPLFVVLAVTSRTPGLASGIWYWCLQCLSVEIKKKNIGCWVIGGLKWVLGQKSVKNGFILAYVSHLVPSVPQLSEKLFSARLVWRSHDASSYAPSRVCPPRSGWIFTPPNF